MLLLAADYYLTKYLLLDKMVLQAFLLSLILKGFLCARYDKSALPLFVELEDHFLSSFWTQTTLGCARECDEADQCESFLYTNTGNKFICGAWYQCFVLLLLSYNFFHFFFLRMKFVSYVSAYLTNCKVVIK